MHRYLVMFNFTKTTRAICDCIFYFMDNSIAGTKESLQIFFFFSLQHVVGTHLVFSNLYLLCDFVKIDEVNTGQFQWS